MYPLDPFRMIFRAVTLCIEIHFPCSSLPLSTVSYYESLHLFRLFSQIKTSKFTFAYQERKEKLQQKSAS